mgnify:CR=1 FL=1
MTWRWSRRQVIASTAAGAAGALVAGLASAGPAGGGKPGSAFRYCFNTATIMGQKLPLDREVEIAAQAGYEAIEPWVRKIEEYAQAGGSLDDLRKRIADRGLVVPSAIGFADWINDDADKRAAGLEQMKRDMDRVARIGGLRIAAPPVGAYNVSGMDLLRVAERYRNLLELGRQMGVVPQIELWGGSKTLRRLGEVAFVLAEAGHPDACTVLDTFHIYRGGSDFSGLRHFNGRLMHVFHMNDYPAEPPKEKISDQYRVFPGDGVAPTSDILRYLHEAGFQGFLSLELFNPRYFKQDPLEVARTGLNKMQSAVAKALG